MEHLELAPKALSAFAAYAEKVERWRETNDVLVFRLFSDGSGRVCGREGYPIYFHFSDLENLLEQLERKMQNKQFRRTGEG